MSKDCISEEDKALFRQVVHSVTPLKKSVVVQSSPRKTPAPLRKPSRPEQVAISEKPTIYLSNFYSEPVSAESQLSYCRHSIPRKRFAELKQGRINWDAKLDLHGLKPEEAAQRLLDFILQQYALEHRCLLIIHGKGSHRNEAPVLKNLVNHWLHQIPQVLAFHSAIPKEGGSGALYVLLKRHRD